VREMGFERFLSARTWGRLRSHALWARRSGVRIIQGFHFHGAFYGALLKRRCPGAALVVCEQAIYGPEAARHRLARSLYYRDTDVVTANCEAVRRAVAMRDRIDPDRIRVIYGGVDTVRFRPRRDHGSEPSGRGPLIGCVGRLHPDKGQMLLIRAAPAILRSLPSARIVLVGDGPQRREIESAIDTAGLTDRVTLSGDRRDVPDLLAGMDLLVLPSASEGFANAALEGAACALPVVVSDAGGNPEIVLDGATGRVFRSGDAAMLAACVVDTLRDPAAARSMGISGRRRVETIFPLAEMVRRHERLYDEILSEAPERQARMQPREAS